ncbi:hypothetical protein P153DRAFT_148710 [Dothidotthia symphoricarpi CBS 119687]|uniref:Uncharacterized protein n=1 Tax=Dothidotthia symphoricarpi CBS 119687 TaxID=1392245 RepID=A0A6A5ZV88_9PLEO|nr:uncharacterized protein P153DRAFT_148710 [Dothidotthia symphoricarpi CBS 119687]KAF2123632.1 hypothetical protein P153DRAFT_148710 [Dothidotthia symphoricarpi CBS 119687]
MAQSTDSFDDSGYQPHPIRPPVSKTSERGSYRRPDHCMPYVELPSPASEFSDSFYRLGGRCVQRKRGGGVSRASVSTFDDGGYDEWAGARPGREPFDLRESRGEEPYRGHSALSKDVGEVGVVRRSPQPRVLPPNPYEAAPDQPDLNSNPYLAGNGNIRGAFVYANRTATSIPTHGHRHMSASTFSRASPKFSYPNLPVQTEHRPSSVHPHSICAQSESGTRPALTQELEYSKDRTLHEQLNRYYYDKYQQDARRYYVELVDRDRVIAECNEDLTRAHQATDAANLRVHEVARELHAVKDYIRRYELDHGGKENPSKMPHTENEREPHLQVQQEDVLNVNSSSNRQDSLGSVCTFFSVVSVPAEVPEIGAPSLASMVDSRPTNALSFEAVNARKRDFEDDLQSERRQSKRAAPGQQPEIIPTTQNHEPNATQKYRQTTPNPRQPMLMTPPTTCRTSHVGAVNKPTLTGAIRRHLFQDQAKSQTDHTRRPDDNDVQMSSGPLNYNNDSDDGTSEASSPALKTLSALQYAKTKDDDVDEVSSGSSSESSTDSGDDGSEVNEFVHTSSPSRLPATSASPLDHHITEISHDGSSIVANDESPDAREPMRILRTLHEIIMQCTPETITEVAALSRDSDLDLSLRNHGATIRALKEMLTAWDPSSVIPYRSPTSTTRQRKPRKAPQTEFFWKKMLKLKAPLMSKLGSFTTTLIKEPTLSTLFANQHLILRTSSSSSKESAELANSTYVNAIMRLIGITHARDEQSGLVRVLLCLFIYIVRYPSITDWVAASQERMSSVDKHVGMLLWDKYMAVLEGDSTQQDGDNARKAAWLKQSKEYVDHGSKYAYIAQNTSLGTLALLLFNDCLTSMYGCSKGRELSGISRDVFRYLREAGIVELARTSGLDRVMHELLWLLVERLEGVEGRGESNDEDETDDEEGWKRFPGFEGNASSDSEE